MELNVCDLKLHLSSSELVLQKASPPEFRLPSLYKGTRKCIKLPEDLPEVPQVFVFFSSVYWISCFILGKLVFLFKFTHLGLYIFQILIIYSYLKILHVCMTFSFLVQLSNTSLSITKGEKQSLKLLLCLIYLFFKKNGNY